MGRRARLSLQRCWRAMPAMQPSDENNPPRPPKGFRTEFDKKGWRH
jgi:hypothetical protein